MLHSWTDSIKQDLEFSRIYFGLVAFEQSSLPDFYRENGRNKDTFIIKWDNVCLIWFYFKDHDWDCFLFSHKHSERTIMMLSQFLLMFEVRVNWTFRLICYCRKWKKRIYCWRRDEVFGLAKKRKLARHKARSSSSNKLQLGTNCCIIFISLLLSTYIIWFYKYTIVANSQVTLWQLFETLRFVITNLYAYINRKYSDLIHLGVP